MRKGNDPSSSSINEKIRQFEIKLSLLGDNYSTVEEILDFLIEVSNDPFFPQKPVGTLDELLILARNSFLVRKIDLFDRIEDFIHQAKTSKISLMISIVGIFSLKTNKKDKCCFKKDTLDFVEELFVELNKNDDLVWGMEISPQFREIMLLCTMNVMKIDTEDKFIRTYEYLHSKNLPKAACVKNIGLVYEDVVARTDENMFSKIFHKLDRKSFLLLISKPGCDGIIPDVVTSKLVDFSDTSFFMAHLTTPQKYLSGESIQNELLHSKSKEKLRSYLKPKFTCELLKNIDYWKDIIPILDEKYYTVAADCFIKNIKDVEQIVELIQNEKTYSESVLKFMKIVLANPVDMLDFNFTHAIKKILSNLDFQPPILFWSLFINDAPFFRIRGILKGRFPFALQGLVYCLIKTDRFENNVFINKLTVPALSSEDLDEVMKYIELDKKSIDDMFVPFTTNRTAVEFISIALYFGIHIPVERGYDECIEEPVKKRPKYNRTVSFLGLTPQNILYFLTIAVQIRSLYLNFPDNFYDSFYLLISIEITIFDKFLADIKVPLSERFVTCFSIIYDAFIKSRAPPTDVGAIRFYDPWLKPCGNPFITSMTKQLWEIHAFEAFTQLRCKFVQTLSCFCGASQYIEERQEYNRKSSDFLSSFGPRIIPFIIETDFPNHSYPKIDLSQFVRNLNHTSIIFSEYIQDASIIKALRFFNSDTYFVPKFSINNLDKIIELFDEVKSLKQWDDCAIIMSFLIDNDCFSSLTISEDEFNEILVKTIDVCPTKVMKKLLLYIFGDEDTNKYALYQSIKSKGQLFFRPINTMIEAPDFELISDMPLYKEVIKMLYIRSPDDPAYFILKINPDECPPPANTVIKFTDMLIEETLKTGNRTMILWLRSIAIMYPFIFWNIKKETIFKLLDKIMEIVVQFETYYNSKDKKIEAIQIPYEASLLFLSLSNISPLVDPIYEYIFSKLDTFSIPQLFVVMYYFELSCRTSNSLITASLMTKCKFVERLPNLFERILKKNNSEMKIHCVKRIIKTIDLYFCILVKMPKPLLITYFEEFGKSDHPVFDRYGYVTFNDSFFMRNCRGLLSLDIKSESTEAHVILSSEKNLFSMSSYSRYTSPIFDAHIRLPEVDYSGIELPESINREEFEELGPRQKSEKLLELMPPLPVSFNSHMHRYLWKFPAWVQSYAHNQPNNVLSPYHYVYLIPIVEKLVELSKLEEIINENMISSILCHEAMIVALLKASIMTDVSFSEKTFAVLMENQQMAEIIIRTSIDYFDISIFHDVTRFLYMKIAKFATKSPLFESFFIKTMYDALLDPRVRESYECLNDFSDFVLRLELDFKLPKKFNVLILYLILNGLEKCFDAAIKLITYLEVDAKKELLAPAVIIFDQCYRKNSPVTKVRWMKLCRVFPPLSDKMKDSLFEPLDDALLNYRPNKIKEIGALLDILSPISIHTELSQVPEDIATSSNVTPPLNIPPSVYLSAVEFWNLVAKHQERLTEITRTHLDLINGSLNFVVRFPILSDTMLKISIFQRSIKPHTRRRRIDDINESFFVTISVDRNNIIRDSMNAIIDISPERLLGNLIVSFKGENGIDAGGLSRDWFSELAKGIFDPEFKLFVPTSNGRALQINAGSGTTPEVLRLFKFVGRFIALALIQKKNINANLTSSLYKHLIGISLSLSDMEQIDESISKSIRSVLDENVDGMMLDFTTIEKVGDELVVIELKPNGSSIMVTEENKIEYVKLKLDYYFKTYASTQIKAFVQGFTELIPRKKLQLFTAGELDLAICGIPEIDIDDMQSNCVYQHPYTHEHPVAKMFFQVIRRWKNEDHVKLLQFVTGSSRVPVGGFKTLIEQGHPFTIGPGGGPERLPVAHTCNCELDIPLYTSEEEMNEKLLFAIRNTNGFGFA